jgi:3-isopropylmalate/(R)-2-methylmalate dehydratase small subunit
VRRIAGKAVVIDQANVDTDVLYPGAYLNITEVEAMRPHLFEGLDPSLRDQCVGDTALVVGENFGVGSSREHVPQAMKASGIRLLVGKSFARIFYRNCLNLGLPVVMCPEAVDAARPGCEIEYDPASGEIRVDGRLFATRPIPDFMREMLDAGGLVEWSRRTNARTRPMAGLRYYLSSITSPPDGSETRERRRWLSR